MKATLVTVAIASLMAMSQAASVYICITEDLVNCVYVTAAANKCTDFPADYNDVVSSVNTGGASCIFYTDGSCGGYQWVADGSYSTIPAAYNDQFSSVECTT